MRVQVVETLANIIVEDGWSPNSNHVGALYCCSVVCSSRCSYSLKMYVGANEHCLCVPWHELCGRAGTLQPFV